MNHKFLQAKWAENENGQIVPISGKLPIQMLHSDATGLPLVSVDGFGADIIRFEGGKGVTNHTHKGAHILFVLKGTGFVEYEGTDYPLHVGVVYMIPGNVDHAIKATTELVLIAVGNDHKPLDSEERLSVIEK